MKFKFVAALLFASLFSNWSHAALLIPTMVYDEAYVGLSAGFANTVNEDFEGDAIGLKVMGGLVFGENFAAELHLADFGKPEDTVNLAPGPTDVSGSLQAVGLDAIGRIPIPGVLIYDFHAFGRVGLVFWQTEFTAQGFKGITDDGISFNFGLGATIRVHPQISIRTEYEFYDFDESGVDMFSIGAQFHF